MALDDTTKYLLSKAQSERLPKAIQETIDCYQSLCKQLNPNGEDEKNAILEISPSIGSEKQEIENYLNAYNSLKEKFPDFNKASLIRCAGSIYRDNSLSAVLNFLKE
jgi:hypothetical protein